MLQQVVRELRSADIYQLDEFRTITRRAVNGELTLDEAAEASERLGKNFADLLRQIDPQWAGVLLSVASMALAVALWCADNADDAAMLEKLEGNRQATISLQIRMDRDAEVDQQLLHTNVMILEELRAARIERAREREASEAKRDPGVIDFAAARAARAGRH